MAAASQSSLPSRRTKPIHHSVGTLATCTFEAFECVSDSDTEVDTITEHGSISLCGPEPTEADLEAEIKEVDDPAELEQDLKILRALGFTDTITNSEPLLPPVPSSSTNASTGVQPPVYTNLFWRAFKASQQPPGKLTAARLAQQNSACNVRAVPLGKGASAASAGEWLGQFKAAARAVPVKDMTARIFGQDIGSDVACFMGNDALDSKSDVAASTMEAPHGRRVLGSKYAPQPLWLGTGRCGFMVEEEATISTPDNSQHQSLMGSETASEAVDHGSVIDEPATSQWWLPRADAEGHDAEGFSGAM